MLNFSNAKFILVPVEIPNDWTPLAKSVSDPVEGHSNSSASSKLNLGPVWDPVGAGLSDDKNFDGEKDPFAVSGDDGNGEAHVAAEISSDSVTFVGENWTDCESGTPAEVPAFNDTALRT